MISKSWTSVFSRFPFNPRFLEVGAIGSILHSTIRLAEGHSADIATTAGMASFVAFSVGAWFGICLVRWMMCSALRFYAKMRDLHDCLRDILDSLSEDLEDQEGSLDIETPNPSKQAISEQHSDRRPSWREKFGVWFSIDLTMYALGFAPIPILVLLLDLGYGLFHLELWRFLAVGFGTVAAVSFAIQRFGFALDEHRVRRMLQVAKELRNGLETSERHRQVLQDTVRLRNQSRDWHTVGPTMARWVVEKVIGISLDEVGQDSVPGTAA